MSKRHRHRRPCPTATKTAFPDRIAADLALAYIRTERDAGHHVSERVPVRSYRCPCGRWHLTSKALSYAEVAQRLDEGAPGV